MKIRSIWVALAATLTLALCSGCTTTGGTQLSPAQVAAIACPQINLAVTELTVINTTMAASPATAAFGAKANASLAAAQPVLASVCAAGATVTSTNLQALAQQALPALATVAGTLPIPPSEQAKVQGALVLAETAMGLVGVVEQQIKAAQAAQGVPVSAASTTSP